jgi:hypothetical protein
MAVAAKLPGIQFQVVSPPATPSLVRMDIAAFAGFAASGPVNLPVAVEAISEFEEIFGADLELALDDLGARLYAYLAPAVRAFFRNGGTRCWIVRLAGPSAVANRFPIPGLSLIATGALTPAMAAARSEGSWSDGITLEASLRSLGLQVTAFAPASNLVSVALTGSAQVNPGDLFKLTFADSSTFWLFIDTVTSLPQPPNTPPGRWVAASGAVSFGNAASVPLPPEAALPICELLTMDFYAQDEDGSTWSLTQLGFSPLHPRYWASLPTDVSLYRMDSPDGLAGEAAYPRFPLAGPPTQNYYIPDGMGVLPAASGQAAIPDGTALDRNGLAVLDASLFLDPALAATGVLDLLSEADYIRYQSGSPRRLSGIHALLSIDEATIVSVPDAVQRGWTPSDQSPLSSPPASMPLAHPEWWHFLDCKAQPPIPAGLPPQSGQFEPLDLQPIEAPVLSSSDVEGGHRMLTWTPLAGAVDFLEEAVDPLFASAFVLYQGSSGSFTVYGRTEGSYYYRLRRQIGAYSSDYSNGIAIRVEAVAGWQILPVSAYNSQMLLDVQSALLRMSAARGDLFALLAMPRHFSPIDALDYAAQLVSSGIEAPALSFGGIYHPWLTGREENDWSEIRTNPPDGAIAGIFATRSSSRGAWISPANEPLQGVVALDPPISPAYRQQYQDAAINLIRQEPGGFTCLCALTLSGDDDLSPINVRRLLSFLRKAVLRAGVDYVFEPNSDRFRRSVQRGFEALMNRLFQLGAFAGRIASQGYQVVTDNTLNTSQAMDAGQFLVDIKVAPSLPMRFLTVRLVQTGDRTFVTEGN